MRASAASTGSAIRGKAAIVLRIAGGTLKCTRRSAACPTVPVRKDARANIIAPERGAITDRLQGWPRQIWNAAASRDSCRGKRALFSADAHWAVAGSDG